MPVWVVLVMGAMAATLAGQAAQNPEDIARRHYELGVGFMQTQKFSEALKDFQTVVDSYPSSSVAGDALIEIARYHLDVERDPVEAQKATDIILKKYSSSPSAAAAYVLDGRIALLRSRTAASINTALASFERVPGLFPGSNAIPSSIYYAGEVLRTVRRNDEALERYRDVTLRYPGSVWAARALIGAASCLVQAGRAVAAMESLQRVRTMFPGSPEAATALNWNTLLYRLYVRAPAQPAYAYSTRSVGAATAKFKDVAAVAVDAQDNVLLAHKGGVAVFDTKGTLVKSITSNSPSALTFARSGTPLFVRENVLSADGGQAVRFSVRQPDGKVQPLEDIASVVATTTGSWLVADRRNKAIQIFSEDGKYEKALITTPVDRFAMNALQDLAVLDRDGKQVALFDWSGKATGRVLPRGAGYELDNPVDLAFDPLGHLYVLDRSRASVFVFNSQAKLITAFSVPEKSPGAFPRATAFALDSAGRLYVFDDRAEHLQLYQ
jgi:TolA-binding protein